MANMWKQFVNKLSGTSKGRALLRARTKRSLSLESLERREVFDITIAGVVFNDVDNNTVLASETPLAGAQVALFRDTNTNGTFDLGTDLQFGATVTTGANGRYSFNVTQADTYFVRQLVTPTGFVQQATQALQTTVVSAGDLIAVTVTGTIDSFDIPTAAAQAANSVAQNSVITAQFSDAGILGGQRDITAEVTSATGSFTSQVSVLSGADQILQISATNNTTGVARIIYDGSGPSDVSSSISDGNFATLFDATANGTAQGIRFRISRDANLGSTVRINFRSSSGTSTSGDLPIPRNNGGALEEFIIPFASITGTADVTQLQAIEVLVSAVSGSDVSLDSLGTYGNVRTLNIANTTAMTIGNQIFLDRNNSGTFDTSGANPDIGIGGVDLQLFNDVNNNQQFDNGTDTAVTIGTATTTSSSTPGTLGQYSFTGLLPGNYIVLVPATEFGAGQPLLNRTSSSGVGTVDVNGTDKGAPISGTFGAAVFAAVALTPAGEPTTDGDDANTNSTIDFGFAPPPVTLTKADAPDPVRTGDQLTYTLTATNTSPTGTASSTTTTITDTLPAGLTLVGTPSFVITSPAGTPGNATFNAGTRVVSAVVGTLTPGQIATLTIIATVGAGFGTPTNPVPNTGTVTNDEGSIVTANTTTTQTPEVDLRIVKSINGNPTAVGVGGALTYKLVLTNLSSVNVTNPIRVDDDLPTGFNPGVLPSGVVAGTAPADLVWTVNTLAAGASVEIDIPITVATNVAPANNIRNTATIRTDLLTGFSDSIVGNNTSFVDINVEPRFDLLITKDNGVTTVSTGSLITYTLSVNNSGPSAAANVVVADTLPASLEFVSATVGGTTFGSIAGQTLSGTIASVLPATTTVITMIARVRSSATGATVVNTATITPQFPPQETGTRPNIATDTDALSRSVLLNTTKTVSTPTVLAGGAVFTYTITMFNTGTADTTNSLFSDPLPTGLIFDSGSFTINETTPRTGTVIFNSTTNRLEANLGTMLAGGTSSTNRALITLNVRAAATAAAGIVSNTATFTSDDNTFTDAVANSTGQINVGITSNFDITVAQTVNRTTVRSGEQLIYTIIVTNSGPSTATNVGVSDILPPQLAFVSATGAGGVVFTNSNGVGASGTVSGTIPSLAIGTPATITLTTTVINAPPNGTVIVNPVAVNAAGETNVLTNNASVSVTVANTADLSGQVYIDTNGNSVRDAGERGIPNVTVTAIGIATGTGLPVTETIQTNANGLYTFVALPLGTYTIRQSQPIDFNNNTSIAGTALGNTGFNEVNGVVLTGNANGYDFPETQLVSKRQLLATTAPTPVRVAVDGASRGTGATRRR